MSIKVTVWFRDSMQRECKRTFGLLTTDVAQAEIDALGLISQLRGNLSVQPCSAVLRVPLTFEITAPAAGSNVDEGVTCECWLAGFKKRGTLSLPCPDNTWRRVDGTAEIRAFGVIRPLLQMFYTGGIATLDDGEQVPVDGWIGGKIDR